MVFGFEWQLKVVMYGMGKDKTKQHLISSISLVWEAFNSPNLGNSKEVPLSVASSWDGSEYGLYVRSTYS